MKTQAPSLEGKMNVVEAARESRMSVAWWRKKLRAREIPHYRIGRRVLVDRADLRDLFERSRVEVK